MRRYPIFSSVKVSELTALVFMTCLLLLCSISVRAKDLYTSAHRITARDGLPETTIFSIAKDKKGFMWFGTPTSLIRYDGYEFREYSDRAMADRKLAVSGAGNIFIDSKNRLWIGTWGEGLVVYDDQMHLLHHFEHTKNTPGTIGSNKIQVIFEDSQGDIWIGTNGGGLSLYQPLDHSFINYVHDPRKAYSISHNRIWSIAESSKGVLWIATSEGLNRLDTNVNNRAQAQFVRYYPEPGNPKTLSHLMVRSVYVDKKGRLWVGTQVDFGRFYPDKGVFEKVKLENGSAVTTVTRISEDQDGNILIGTMQGMFHYDADKHALSAWAGANKYQLFPQNDIRDLMVDAEGILWVSTRYAGLIKIDLTPGSFTPRNDYFDLGKHERFNRIFDAKVDAEGTLWLAGSSGLLYRHKGELVFSRYRIPQLPSEINIMSLGVDQQGNLWLGLRTGLLMVDIKNRTVVDRKDLLTDIKTKNITSLLFDSLGGKWIGSAHDGLIHVDKDNKLTRFLSDKKSSNAVAGNSIQVLFEDSDNQIWIGTTSNGLSRYDLTTGKFYGYRHHNSKPQSLSDDTINDILQSADGVMWFATPKSLDRFDAESEQFLHYRVDDGLINSNVKALAEDDAGNLWLSTIRGVSQFKRENRIFHNFTADEEVGNTNFLPHVSATTQDGRIVFGGVGGVSEVSPSGLSNQSKPPNTEIVNIWVDNQRLAFDAYSGNEPLTLSYGTKSLQIEFAALDFHRPYENKYMYRLEGVDKQWHGPGTTRSASYSGLKPGDYRFTVKGSNSRNQWAEQPTVLMLHIEMPWYRIGWIQALLVVAALGSVYFIAIYRYRNIERKKTTLEIEVAARTKELDEKNEQLAKTIARLNQSQKELVEKEKMASLGQMVAGIAHEVNTPIGLGVTASTLLRQRIEEVRVLFDDKKLNAGQFDKFLDEAKQNAGIIYRNLERAASLINGFKQVAVDQSTERARYFNVAGLLDETLLSLSPNFHNNNHQLKVQCDRELEVYSKPGAFTQIVINLVMNSLNHAFDQTDKGTMNLEISISDSTCQMVYTDDGCGVPEQIKQTIFDPFVTTRRGKGSTGLGMHLVYNMVTQALGGSISFDSEVGKGVVVTVSFPVDVRSSRKAAVAFV